MGGIKLLLPKCIYHAISATDLALETETHLPKTKQNQHHRKDNKERDDCRALPSVRDAAPLHRQQQTHRQTHREQAPQPVNPTAPAVSIK